MLDLSTGQIYLRSFSPVRPEALDLEAGRIVVRDETGEFRPLTFGERARMRVTCAHEIGHALFHDFNVRPARRTAPSDLWREEERLCDYAARHFLLPSVWVEPELAGYERPTPDLLRACAARYAVGLDTAAVRAAEWFAPRMAPERFYLLSGPPAPEAGRHAAGGVVQFLSPQLRGAGVSFLTGGRSGTPIRWVGGAERDWSLREFHTQLGLRRSVTRSDLQTETLRCPSGVIIRVSSIHYRIGNTATVWTEGRIEEVARDAAVRSAA
jgi:hypothetical protein